MIITTNELTAHNIAPKTGCIHLYYDTATATLKGINSQGQSVPLKGAVNFEDFTPEQRESIRGLKGEQGIQGLRGVAFKYADFTNEQINGLKVKGDKGENGSTLNNIILNDAFAIWNNGIDFKFDGVFADQPNIGYPIADNWRIMMSPTVLDGSNKVEVKKGTEGLQLYFPCALTSFDIMLNQFLAVEENVKYTVITEVTASSGIKLLLGDVEHTLTTGRQTITTTFTASYTDNDHTFDFGICCPNSGNIQIHRVQCLPQSKWVTNNATLEALKSQKFGGRSELTALEAVLLAKIADSIVKPNLLRNGNFDIWQRGESFTSSNIISGTVGADGWYVNYATGKFNNLSKLATGGMKVDFVTTGGTFNNTLRQKLENAPNIATATIKFKGTNGLKIKFMYQNIASSITTYYGDVFTCDGSVQTLSATFEVPNGVSRKDLAIDFYEFQTGQELEIYKTKLEEGRIFTGWTYPTYSAELIENQRYYYQIHFVRAIALASFSVVSGGNASSFPVYFPIEMRTTPTFHTGTWQYYIGSGNWIDSTNMSSQVYDNKMTLFRVASNNNENKMIIPKTNEDGILSFSAEL